MTNEFKKILSWNNTIKRILISHINHWAEKSHHHHQWRYASWSSMCVCVIDIEMSINFFFCSFGYNLLLSSRPILTIFFLLSPYFWWSGKEKIFGLTRDFDFDFLFCLVLKQQSGSNVRLPLFIRKIDHLEFSFHSFIHPFFVYSLFYLNLN